MPIPPGYASVTVEQIVGTSGDNENLELDFVGGDGQKTLGDALHGIVLCRKADIKLIGNTTAPVDPGRPSPQPPSPPSPQPPSPPSLPVQRATSTPTPPALEKGKKKTSSLPPPTNWTHKQEAENGRKENSPVEEISLRDDR